MAIQFDVKSLERATSGTVFAGPARVKGVTISYATGGTVVIKDGGASGTTVWSFTAPAAAGSTNIPMPGDGIRCNTDIYVALTSATATVVYG
jgi:hypothetical protein